jgi:hypothetical protein
MTEEEDQYMDWAVGGADEPEAAAPMAASRVLPQA